MYRRARELIIAAEVMELERRQAEARHASASHGVTPAIPASRALSRRQPIDRAGTTPNAPR